MGDCHKMVTKKDHINSRCLTNAIVLNPKYH